MVKPGQRPPPPPPHAKQQGQEHEDDAEVARATANAPPAPMLAPPPLPIAQAFPARRETGPMGDRARQEDICAVCYQVRWPDCGSRAQPIYVPPLSSGLACCAWAQSTPVHGPTN